jgi:tripartite-type tricarboxylate transporter receptor subunit TctC
MRTFHGLLGHGLTALALIFASPHPAGAGSWPSNVVRIIVPTPPATPPDILSRVIANELSEHGNWRIIVENRPGALQSIAMAEVLKQPADGYTILAMSVPVMVAPALLPNLQIAPDVDFSPIIQISKSYTVLVTSPSLPVHSVSELIAALKEQPGKFNFSSGGFGTPSHLIGELFKLKTGVHAAHVPYPQGQQRMVDLMSGTVHFDFVTTVLALNFISTGKLAALAVMGPNRIEALKNVPTIVEQGFPDLVVEDWVGFAAKNGTPNEVVVRLNEAINAALKTAKVREAFAALGAQPVGGSAAEFGNLMRLQSALWAKVVKDSGITLPK